MSEVPPYGCCVKEVALKMPWHAALGSAPAEMSCSLRTENKIWLQKQSRCCFLSKQLAHVGICDLAVFNGMLFVVQVNILPQMGKTIGDGSPKSNGSNGASAMPSLQTR